MMEQAIEKSIKFYPNFENCLAVAKCRNDWKGWIVLRENKGAVEPYVTHYFNGESGGYHIGHYFSSLDRAQSDFVERMSKS